MQENWEDIEESAYDEDEELELFEHHRIRVDKGQELLRIDKFLLNRIAHTTRNKIQAAIKNDFVKVNEQPVKANYKVRPDDVITISLPQPPPDGLIIPEDIPINIIYEDEDLLVVYKPAGMVVHPAYHNRTGTLLNALVHHFQNLPENSDGRPALVHRIDKDTTGLLVVAKSELAMSHLAKQFFDKTTKRTYYAIIWGEPKESKGTIDVYLGRSLKDRRIVTAYPDESHGKHAVTHYEVVKSLRYVSLVKCRLETGRTHQIRAHFKYIGNPLFNDAMYGGDKVLKGTVFSKYKTFVENCFKILPRQALHAQSLGFVHPRTGKEMFFETELPEDFQQALDKWEHYVQYN